MTPPFTPLEQWLADATKGLSPESAARVRTEIQEHHDSAREAGGDADAVAALGDPREANRGYRKVLLTEREAMLAPALTQAQPRLGSSLLGTGLLAALMWWTARGPNGSSAFPVLLAIVSTLPFTLFFSKTTLELSRFYLYIRAARLVLVVAVSWWFQSWSNALFLGAFCFALEYFTNYQRVSVFKKIAAGQTFSPLAGEPQLTHIEAIHLRTLEKGSPNENIAVAVLFLMLAGITAWLPSTFAPVTICMAAGFVAQRTVWPYTEEGSRWFRIVKWTTMTIAAIFPVLYGARIPWIGAFYFALFFVLFDRRSIALRLKLPVAEWPKRLYW